MKNFCAIAFAPAAALALGAASAHAGITSIDYADVVAAGSGPAAVDAGGLITANNIGGAYAQKTVQGVSAVGIAGGAVSAEIDNNEAITFTFDIPVFVTELSIAHLYTEGNFNDNVDESARFDVEYADAAAPASFVLTATDATAGDWTGAGTLTNSDIATEAGGGWWTVAGSDIFNGAVTSLTLRSNEPGNHRKADFGFVSLAVAPVPTPGAIALSAVAGLLAVRRRRA